MAQPGGQVTDRLPGQRPHGGPVDRHVRLEGRRHAAEVAALRVPTVALAVLASAEQRAVAGVDGVLAELLERRAHARVAGSGERAVALQRLAEAADLGLEIRRRLAVAGAAERVAQPVEAGGRRRVAVRS